MPISVGFGVWFACRGLDERMDEHKKCPRCGTINLSDAQRCDCGFPLDGTVPRRDAKRGFAVKWPAINWPASLPLLEGFTRGQRLKLFSATGVFLLALLAVPRLPTPLALLFIPVIGALVGWLVTSRNGVRGSTLLRNILLGVLGAVGGILMVILPLALIALLGLLLGPAAAILAFGGGAALPRSTHRSASSPRRRPARRDSLRSTPCRPAPTWSSPNRTGYACGVHPPILVIDGQSVDVPAGPRPGPPV